MLRRGDNRGDTIIEVVFALAILSFVLVGSTMLAAQAFRLGQTARERTVMADEAQAQMEALRSFRDNHTTAWTQFRDGDSANCTGASVGDYCGIDNADTGSAGCLYAKPCFHMEQVTLGPDTEWVPVPGGLAGTVPTSNIEISTTTPGIDRNCGYDFTVEYSFVPLGGSGSLASRDYNVIQTRLVNLTYAPPGLGPQCP